MANKKENAFREASSWRVVTRAFPAGGQAAPRLCRVFWIVAPGGPDSGVDHHDRDVAGTVESHAVS